MTHRRTVEREFARQAHSFAAAPALRTSELTEGLAQALGDGPFERILDVACGPGVLAPQLSPRAGQVVCVDVTPAVLRLARQSGDAARLPNLVFARCLAERLPFAHGSFDAAVLRLALHHFDQPLAALRGLGAALRPGGRLALLDLLGSEDPETARLHDAIERLRDPSHHALRTGADLQKLVREAGFRITRCQTWRRAREVREWAAIVADAGRAQALELVLRALCRAGVSAGISLREVDGDLWMTYTWCLLVAEAGADAA